MSRWAILLIVAPVLLCCGPTVEDQTVSLSAAARDWNVIFLSVDTLRADHLNSYGYKVRETSRAIDSLLGAGARFEMASAARASTWPSLTTVFSGLYPSAHGVLENGYRFPDDLVLLHHRLGDAGYQTGAFLANMCGANHSGWDKLHCSVKNDSKSLNEALRWAESLESQRPFFLWYHQFGTHPPYQRGKDLADELIPGYQGPVVPTRRALNRIMTESVELGEEDLQYLNALYDGALQGADQRVGTVLTWLRDRGLEDRTIVVFFSDHGEDLYQHHGYLFHSCSVYQTGLHVPLGIRAQGLVEPSTIEAPVRLTDLTPTLLELLGLPVPEGLHGVSLIPWLENPSRPGSNPAFSEYGTTRIRTVVKGPWKLVANPDRVDPVCFKHAPEGLYPIGSVELYNLASDPAESTDLSAKEPDRVVELLQLIDDRFQNLQGIHGRQEIPTELQEQLEALGYVVQ